MVIGSRATSYAMKCQISKRCWAMLLIFRTLLSDMTKKKSNLNEGIKEGNTAWDKSVCLLSFAMLDNPPEPPTPY